MCRASQSHQAHAWLIQNNVRRRFNLTTTAHERLHPPGPHQMMVPMAHAPSSDDEPELELVARSLARPPRRPYALINYGHGPAGLRALRDLNEEMMMTTTPLGPVDDFRAKSAALHLGAAIVAEYQATALDYVRTPLHIARSGIDHYMIYMIFEGIYHIEIGPRTATLRAGNLCVVDMGAPTHIRVVPAEGRTRSRHLSLLLPRPLLAPLLAEPDSVFVTVIRDDEPHGLVVRDHVASIWRHSSGLDATESESVVRALVHLLAGALRSTPAAEPQIALADAAARRTAIKRHLEHNLGSMVDVDGLGRRFGVSRAALYRLFEADGGIVRYVQQRRLRRALAMVLSPTGLHARVADIALQHGFGSESSFIRAFRREFGSTPGELRTSIATSRIGWMPDSHPWFWIPRLEAPPPCSTPSTPREGHHA